MLVNAVCCDGHAGREARRGGRATHQKAAAEHEVVLCGGLVLCIADVEGRQQATANTKPLAAVDTAGGNRKLAEAELAQHPGHCDPRLAIPEPLQTSGAALEGSAGARAFDRG